MKKVIFWLFAALIFFVPIILWPYTSEVFEFNKMVLTYALTILILAFWIVRMILERKFIFRRTILDIPILIFLGSQLISTLLSIDFYTSVFGYYSRFNGGMLSLISYAILYWAFVSNFDAKEALNLIKVWFISALLVCIYAVLEHFGIDKKIWVQDVQSRVFSTLGQPNWLAEWVVALSPVAWALTLESGISNQESGKNSKFLYFFSISVLLFWTLIFTESRSGYLAIAVAFIVFWGFYFGSKLKDIKKSIVPFLVIGFSFLVICLISGTEFTPSISQLMNHQKTVMQTQVGDTALETGGTESGVIRQIVWNGAIQVWFHYPVFGTGTETFAYAYYLYRPVAHNLTSEWNFVYNKAHNEFLNFAATSGTVGLLAYLALIIFSIIAIAKRSKDENWNLKIALLAGYISLSVSNFFGFSVVPTQLQFFLFPAIAIALAVPSTKYEVLSKKTGNWQRIFIFFVLCTMFYVLWLTANYWQADTFYSKAKAEDGIPRPDLAIPLLIKAENLEPYQYLYHSETASSYAVAAMAYDRAKDSTTAAQFSNLALTEIQNAANLSPANVNLQKTIFGIYIRLSIININYLANARDTLIYASKLSPTDPVIYYYLGITYANLKDMESAGNYFQKAIDLKSNYADARIEYAAVLSQFGKIQDARDQLNYVLTKIDPNNPTAKQNLANLK